MDILDVLTEIAKDLSSALDARSRYDQLLAALHRAIPYDAAALLRITGNALAVVAYRGLSDDAAGRRFHLDDHPRLNIICNSKTPFLFPSDSTMPDPFDGLLAGVDTPGHRIHSCLGCPLHAAGRLVGVLTADALDPEAFESLDTRFLCAIAALAGAELHTTDLMRALEVGAEKMGLIAQDLMREARGDHGDEMIGTGAAMQRLRREIDLVAPSDFTVLVTGETGVGKELVVRAIHSTSKRSDQPLLYANCANLTESLAESELFGHMRGAYTGAVSDRVGKFELADRGTLFLDEIGELPLVVQPKLLRALQEGEVQRIGAARPAHVNVRVLAATNRDLAQEIAAGRFRADLFHRLNVYPLRVPPLRERPEDIPMLSGHFCDRAQRRIGCGPVRLTRASQDALKDAEWPGNVRELENTINRAVLRAAGPARPGDQVTIEPEHLVVDACNAPVSRRGGAVTPDRAPLRRIPLKIAVEHFKEGYIVEAVNRNGGNWAAAARELGMNRGNLHKLATRLKIK